MRLNIAAIGRLKPQDPKAILINDYLDRIEKTGRNMGFMQTELREIESPRGLTGMACKTKESALLLEAIPGHAHAIILDERGRDMDSVGFARLLEDLRDQGVGMAVFAIGGADGHTDEIRQRANHKIAFGKATWPHMLARLMLCEQLYRAMTILSGHPYHRV